MFNALTSTSHFVVAGAPRGTHQKTGWRFIRASAFILPILPIMIALTGCGSITVPAAVKMANGEALIGTTTAAISGGTFQVSSPSGNVVCSGNYDALDTRPVITAPVKCNDGRFGKITVVRAPDGGSGAGTVTLADGSTGNVAFGRAAASVLTADSSPATADQFALNGTAAGVSTAIAQPNGGAYSAASLTDRGASVPSSLTPRQYTDNCPTPESLDAAGRRCGARSAASRAGGYDGYGSWANSSYGGGSVYVGGYYRKNGTYVRGYTRRR